LTSATYPDDKSRIYHYEHTSLKHHLTGITDENGNRFATYAYDSYSGRAISTQHAGGADKFSFVYNTNATTVTDALATTRVYGLQSILGAGKITSISQPCADCAASSTYDSNGNLASRKDFNGNLTCYTNDTTRNLETKRVEGLSGTACPGTAGAATRTINTEWHPTWQLPARIAQPNRITTYSYDTHANLISKSIQATTDSDGSLGLNATASGSPRAWTYTHTYHPTITGFITQTVADGPRTDVSDTRTFAYDSSNGSLASITNALGQVTTFSNFDAHGRPQRVTDPNGLITDLTYDLRGRLIGRTVGGELAAYQYDGVGQLTKITLPDGSYLIYTYDAAHRLTHIQDNLGNKIIYTLDAIGNRTQEQVFDPSNTLAQTRNRVFNSLNRLYRELGALSQITEYAYDNQGNVTSVKNPLNHVTTNQFDALNRLKQVTDPSPISGVTQYAYNGQDQLIQVTDPRGLATGYTIDGLGNLSQQSSPDSGNTVNTYDAAGNLATQTDARGQQTSYTYDALNRITLITFHDGSKQEYAYDAGTYGIGRLTGITERDPANQITAQTAYAYDAHGRILTDARTLAGITYTTAYRYDPSGRRDRITYPSGRTVDFAFDSLGRVSSVSTTPPSGAAQTLASGITYQPFGGLKSFTFGNAQTYARTYDLDGRISSYTLGGTQYSLGYDAASRITLVTEAANPPNTNTYDYDALDRLTSAILPLTSYGYTYDPVGNRLTRTAGSSTDTYTYSSTSNRLADLTPPSGPVRTFGFDPNGSTTADGNNTYAYDVRGRMTSSTSSLGTTTYQVNALGQRIRKTSSLGDSVFHYDDKGHLMAESTAAGATVREYVWLGDTPLAVASSATVHYVHIDHLNTPRLVANAAGQTVWLWHQGEPFGNSVPDENPSGLGAFDLPLRLPGQYFDRETNLHYNYYRDYDASIGTYKESDLIGLAGGLNTYVYVAGNPLSLVDVRGLFPDHDRERPEQRAQRERPENARPNNAKGPSKEEAEKWGCYQICVPREYEGKTKKVALMCAALTVIFTYGGFQGGGPAGAYAGFGMGMGLTAGTAAANMYEVDRLCREECGLPKNSWF
jgi:RHS repeat-associated protein